MVKKIAQFVQNLSIYKKAILGVAIALGTYFSWQTLYTFFTQNKVQGISEEFMPMHEALSSADKPEKTYNLEETIRIIHAIEHAKLESAEFDDFLVFMASQDYTMVAPDVIECQKQLLPILQNLYFQQDRLAENESAWTAVRGLVGVIPTALSAGVSFANRDALGGIKNSLAAAKQTFETFDEIDNQSNELKDAVRSIKDDYLNYLESYTKVYFTHMKNWDRLCLHRDRAYLDIHQGRLESALISVNKALEISPEDRESKILKALCLTQISGVLRFSMSDSIPQQPELSEASELLEQYLKDNSSRSAPALLVKGIINWKRGNREAGFSDFDQSSIEYPRQANLLTDMFNSYQQRAYLSKSQESHYVLELYKSSMEGFGIFSPNFHKAIVHQNEGNQHLAQEEIRRHFFRRGGQVVADYLISDVSFCNTYLQVPFSSMFKEKGFVDIEIKPASSIFGAKNSLKVSIVNRTDKQIQNARLFLCIHFTDMYKDDYAVIKMPNTIDRLNPKEVFESTVSIDYTFDGKRKDVETDIVSARAIMITDNFISWIDGEEFKISRAEAALNDKLTDSSTRSEIAESMKKAPITESVVYNLIRNSLTAVFEDGYLSKELKINVPRQLAELEPVFSIGDLNSEGRILPKEAYLSGASIKTTFKVTRPKDGLFVLHMVTKYYSCKVRIKYEGGICKIDEVLFL